MVVYFVPESFETILASVISHYDAVETRFFFLLVFITSRIALPAFG